MCVDGLGLCGNGRMGTCGWWRMNACLPASFGLSKKDKILSTNRNVHFVDRLKADTDRIAKHKTVRV